MSGVCLSCAEGHIKAQQPPKAAIEWKFVCMPPLESMNGSSVFTQDLDWLLLNHKDFCSADS